MEASSEDIRNDWVEGINAAIEMGKGRNFDSPPDPDQMSAEEDSLEVEELPGDVEPVPYPDGLADFCQVIDSIQWILFMTRSLGPQTSTRTPDAGPIGPTGQLFG